MLISKNLLSSFLMTVLIIISSAGISADATCRGEEVSTCSRDGEYCHNFYTLRDGVYYQCQYKGGSTDYDCGLQPANGDYQPCTLPKSVPATRPISLPIAKPLSKKSIKAPAWTNFIKNIQEMIQENQVFCHKGGLFTKTVRSSSGELCVDRLGASIAIKFCAGILDFDKSHCADKAKQTLSKIAKVQPTTPKDFDVLAGESLHHLIFLTPNFEPNQICEFIAKVLPNQETTCLGHIATFEADLKK